MHILISLITAVAGLIWALNRLQNSGVNLNAFNPFAWYRRNQWLKKASQKPLYNLSDSVDVASVLIFGMAKLTGEITREQKQEIIEIYSKTFNLSEKEASDIYTHSSFLLRDEFDLIRSVKKIIEGSKEAFTDVQIESLMGILDTVSKMEREPNELQIAYLDAIKKELKPTAKIRW